MPKSGEAKVSDLISRKIEKQEYGKLLSHEILDWPEIFHDKLLIERIHALRYKVESNKARLFRIKNCNLKELKKKMVEF